MLKQDEPSYLAFARMNVNDGLVSSPTIVRELLDRIDRDAKTIAQAVVPPNKPLAQWEIDLLTNDNDEAKEPNNG